MNTRAAPAAFLLAVLLASTAMLPAAAAEPAAADPALRELSHHLTQILIEGRIPDEAGEPEVLETYRHPDYGVAADYRAWIGYLRDYNRTLRERHAYDPPAIVRALEEDPINAPWRFDAWLRAAVTEPAGGLDQALRLWAEAAGQDPAGYAVRGLDISFRTLEDFVQALDETARGLDEEALGAVPPEARALLSFVVPWICRVGGRFRNASKGAPAYGFHRIFAPADPFTPGAEVTSASGTPVPPALHSMTGLYHYLRALAGQPVVTAGIVGDAGADAAAHPTFSFAVDRAAFGAGLARVAALLTPEALDRLAGALRTMTPDAGLRVDGVEGDLLAVFDTPRGRVVVGGPGPNRYTDPDVLAILDAGGDDEYRWTRASEARLGARPLQVIVDFAGDDLYVAEGVGGPAAGVLGISVLVDRAGNDRYFQGVAPGLIGRGLRGAGLVRPDPEGVDTRWVPFVEVYGDPERPDEPGVALDAGFAFGAGFLGVGVLVDEAGDDLYAGQKYAFGAAMWRGVGVLHDAAGDDVYVAGLAALGAGINGAFGLLDDRGGNDHYQCLGLHESAYSAGREWDNGYEGGGIGYGASWRGEARGDDPARRWPATGGGGVGLLRDAGGDDHYVGSSFGVGAAYAGGIGAVVDDGGDDTWFVKRGPGGENRSGWSGNHALGNGCHRGVGLVLDRGGNDRYSASGLGGGTAWDLGTGFLLDLGGDDRMTDLHGKNLGGNTGWGAAKGFAVSFHAGGADVYERSTFGDASAIGDGYPGVGGNFSFFFDLGPEEDVYPAGSANESVRFGSNAPAVESDGRAYPQGIGLFVDGRWP